MGDNLADDMATVAAVLRKDKTNTHGTAPIYLRFSDRSRSTYTSLGVRVRPADWNERTGTVRKSHPKAAELNVLIKTRMAEAGAEDVRLRTAGATPTAGSLKAAVAPDARSGDFYAFAAAVADEFERRGSVGRALTLRTMAKRLAEISPGVLRFDALTPALLRAYETYLLTHVGNRPNTIRTYLTSLRAVLYRAIREGHAEQAKNPFFNYRLPKEERSKRAKLTADELRRIEDLDLTPDSLAWRVRACFLFSFYCAGIRFGDLARLTWEHVTAEPDGGMRLSYRMSKTAGLKSVRLLPQAQAILDAFPPRPGSPYLFPILDGYDLTAPRGLRSGLASQNALANKYLRKIATAAGVKVTVSTHVARHSFADIARTRGWDVYSISKALGHANIKVTENYLRGFDTSALDDKMQNLFAVPSADPTRP